MRAWIVLVLVVLGGGVRQSVAQEPPMAEMAKGFDQRLNQTLRDVINRGADLYNAGDPAGSYHLFLGALLTAKPLLDHRPEAQKIIDAGLAEGAREADFKRRAWALRRTLDDVRTQLLLKGDKLEEKKPEPEK